MMKCIKSDATELNPYKGKSEGRESWGSRQGPDPDGVLSLAKELDCGPCFQTLFSCPIPPDSQL